MPDVVFYFQVHQPYRLMHGGFRAEDDGPVWFDDSENRRILDRVAERCYLPMNALIAELIDKTDGVFITDVEAEGSGAEKGLRPGDVIVEVDQEEVHSPDDVATRIERAKDEGFRVVTLLVFRQGDFQWIAVRIDQG